MAALRPCTADDLDALLSPACAASTLAPLACGALVLVLSAVRLGQLLAPRVGLLRTPERTSQGRVLVFVLVLGAAGGSAWVGWSAAGALERVVSAVAAGGWAFGALVALSSLHAAATGGGWHVGGSALAGAAAAAPVALAMLRVPWAEPWTEPDATSEQVAAALCQLGAAAAMLLCALLEASGVLAANESPAGLMEPLLAHTADDGTFHDEAPVSAGLCPEASAGPLSRIMFGWMSPLLAIGALRPIQPSDLWELDLPDRTEALIARWKLAPKNSGAVRGLREVVGARFLAGGVFRLLSDASQLGTPVLLNLLLEYLQQGDALAAPDEEKESEKGTLAYGIGLALLLFTSQLAQSLFDNQYFWRVLRSGIQARAVLCSQVSAKVLRLSHGARATQSTGRLNALIAADAEAIELCIGTLHLVWSALLRICVALFLLYLQLGPSAFSAVAAMVLLIPLQTSLVMRSARAQKRSLQHTDERVRALSEAVGSITTLKCYAWEGPALARVLGCRESELEWLRVRVVLNALNFAMISLNLTMMAASTFTTFTLTGGVLDASKTFTSIALFGNLQGPLFLVPQAVSQLVSARVSVRRLDELLQAEELPTFIDEEERVATWSEGGGERRGYLPPSASGEWESLSEQLPPPGVAVEFRGADFAWDAEGQAEADGQAQTQAHAQAQAQAQGQGGASGTAPLLASDAVGSEQPGAERTQPGAERTQPVAGAAGAGGAVGAPLSPTADSGAAGLSAGVPGAPTPTLRAVSLSLPRGALVAVVGGTGEGKSSLLAALLGDLPAVQAELRPRMRGSVAYCAQASWVFPGTVRENILFGKPFDAARYAAALWAADLGTDVQQMGGDDAELGERGVNVSGGQKQRISLARAHYADADIYVLDDVLSALDAAVAAKIFKRFLLRDLRGKGRTCVFATNRLEFVSQCDEVVVVHGGGVLDAGPVRAVRARCEYFGQIMANSTGDTDTSGEGGDDMAGADEAEEGELLPDAAAPANANPPATGTGAASEGVQARTLVVEEHRDKGQITSKVFIDYFRAAGGPFACAGVAMLFALKTCTDYASNWWLSQWSAASEAKSAGSTGAAAGLLAGEHSTAWWLCGYLLIQLCGVCFTLSSQVSVALCGLAASRELARRLSTSLLCAPLSFFHANPTGRLINVAIKDQRDVDQVLVTNLAITLMISFSLCATLVVIVVALPWTPLVIAPLVCFFIRTRNAYQRSLIEIKRWGAVTRSPIYVLFSQCLDGLFTIRAYRASPHMLGRMSELIDDSCRWDLAEQAASRWLSMRLAWIGGLLTLACALGGVFMRGQAGGAASVGLMLSYALSLSFSLIMVTRLSSQTENSFNAVERVLHYGSTPPENGGLDRGADPPRGWPDGGRLEFRHVSVRYKPELPDVLCDVTFTVQAGEKVGIVGRTGAGKSSLVAALFRLVQPYRGQVLIDGADALSMKLSGLRSKIGIIPQEPVLLSGSIRYNLDPFDQFSDLELWSALRQAHLSDYVAVLPLRLEAEISEGGSNLSVGQRQLLCMARALARRCCILVMDEATAAVDSDTDRLIQTSLREAFKDATVLTIAHRLHTVIDSNKVMLLSQGALLEFGEPHALLADEHSAFSQLVDSTGEAAAASLRATALAVAQGGLAGLPPPSPLPPSAEEALPPPPRPPFAKQISGRLRCAAFATNVAARMSSAGSVGGSVSLGAGRVSSRRGTGDSVLALGSPPFSPSSSVGGSTRAAPSVEAVRASLELLSAAVREGSHSAQWAAALANGRVSAAEWYAELGAVLAALAKEAERARAELQDEHADDDADWTARGREDIMLSTQA